MFYIKTRAEEALIFLMLQGIALIFLMRALITHISDIVGGLHQEDE